MRTIIIMGKGGVGKSTIASLLALRYSQTKETLLISLDPAHNLTQIWQTKNLDKKPKVPFSQLPNLSIFEAREELYREKLVKKIRKSMLQNFQYQSSFNLDKHFKLMEYAPGIGDHALYTAMDETVLNEQRSKTPEIVILDMPPTGAALQFLSMPFGHRQWLQGLLLLRKKITKKKEIIEKIKNTAKSKEKITNLLELHIHQTNQRISWLQSPDTQVIPVLIDEPLAQKEWQNINIKLQQWQIQSRLKILNRTPASPLPTDKDLCIPHSATPLLGISSLEKFNQQLNKEWLKIDQI